MAKTQAFLRYNHFFAFLLLALAAVAYVFSFAPTNFWPLQCISLGILAFVLVKTQKSKNAFFIGWFYGTIALGSGVYWLFVSLHYFGSLNIFLSALSVVVMGLTLGFFPALACLFSRFLANRLNASNTILLLMIFPSLWTITEWLRGWVLTGLPWLLIGYAHTLSPLKGFAPVFGVYGVSFFAALISGALALIFLTEKNHRTKTIICSISAIVLSFLIGFGLNVINWTNPSGRAISVRLLQGNIPQEFKFSKEQINATINLYAHELKRIRADLVVTPETAIPVYPHQLPPGYLQSLAQAANENESNFAISIPLHDKYTVYTNSVIVLTPESILHPASIYRYNKHHLVPFGEFIPTGFKWFVRMLRIPLGDFTRGAELQLPFAVKDQQILPNICYEDVFGEEIASQIKYAYKENKAVPTILLNVSNIAWFGDTFALPQHLQISSMRAIETARPMMRSTNTGFTTIIDEKGHVTHALTPYTRGEIYAQIRGQQGLTPYIYWGNIAIIAIAIIILIASWFVSRKKR